MIASGTLQAATTISKTTQTLMGAEIHCANYDHVAIYLDYVNGDETGVAVQLHYMHTSGGTAYQDMTWTAAAGTKTFTANAYKMTATGNYRIEFDLKGAEYIKFTQGGSDNDGTPTGTLAAKYVLSTYG